MSRNKDHSPRAIRFYIAEISFSSPSHTGLRSNSTEIIPPRQSKNFCIDVFDDDDQEVRFVVSGLPRPVVGHAESQ